MAAVHDHSKRVRSLQEAYVQHDAPLLGNDSAGCVGSNGCESGADDLQPLTCGNDEAAKIDAELVNIWTQRLQILTVVATFLTTMDGELFALTALNTQIGLPASTRAREAVYSCLAGALIFHICATMLAYVTSFVLIRYRIVETSGEDDTKVGDIPPASLHKAHRAQHPSRKIIAESVHPLHGFVSLLQRPANFQLFSISRSYRPAPRPPLSLLTRCYYTTLYLSILGFFFALVGIMAYVWDGLPPPVGVFSTICLCIGIGASLTAIAL